MESISWLVKVSLPSYLQSLPIPNTLSGFQKLSGGDFISLIFFTVVTLTIIYATAKLLLPRRKPPVPLVNRKVKKDNPKVVDVVDIEDIHEDKVLYCRCWKSEKFPYCDGSHNKHNEESKDNVGPLILKRLEK